MAPASVFHCLKEPASVSKQITHLHTILLWEMLWRSKQSQTKTNSRVSRVKTLPHCEIGPVVVTCLHKQRGGSLNYTNTSEASGSGGRRALVSWDGNQQVSAFQPRCKVAKWIESGNKEKEKMCSIFNQYSPPSPALTFTRPPARIFSESFGTSKWLERLAEFRWLCSLASHCQLVGNLWKCPVMEEHVPWK